MEQVRACKNKLQRRESGKDPQVTRRAWRGGGNAYPLVSYGVVWRYYSVRSTVLATCV